MRLVLWSISLLMCLGLRAGEAAAQQKHAAMVIDANNGRVMHSDQADELRFPASLTKVMTIYLAFEAIERGRASYATRIKVSHEAASQPPTKLDLEPGETIALGDAIKALITKSANDVAVAIAEHLGGSEARFARMMTEKARLFGMSNTTFRNASGLPDPGQVTTARDMVRLALRLQDDFPRHYHLFSTRSFSYDGSSYRNHNTLLHRFQGTEGIKTGYTRASGFNLVASVRRGGRHVIGVVMGGRTAARRDDAMQLLLSRALISASPYKIRRSAPVLVAAATPAQRPRAQATFQPPSGSSASVDRPRPVMVPPRPRVAPPATVTAPWPSHAPAPVPAVRPQLARVQAGGDDRPMRPATIQRPADPAGLWAQPVPGPLAGGPMRGAAPSTLHQQAMNMSRGADPVTPPARRLAPAPSGVGTAGQRGPGFEIQVGAYATAADADRALAVVRQSASDVIGNGVARTIAVRKDTRQVFRARFAGFDSRSAAGACLELRRRRIDCFVMRAE